MAAMILALLLAGPALEGETSWKVPALHAAGVVIGMRAAASALWPAAYDPTRFSDEGRNLKAAFTRPPDFRPSLGLLRSDGDPWAINVFGHGAFGSEIYLRTRQCGHEPWAALAATALTSTAWEYLVEGPYKRPSAIDLVWTPLVGGLVLGEARFRLWRAIDSRFWRAVIDPLGSLERAAGSRC
jgi:hypothetical protein